MGTLNDIRLLFLTPFMQYLRNPMFIFVNLATPIMYLVLFMPLLKNLSGPGLSSSDIVQIFLPGIIALLFASAGLFSVFPTIFDLNKGVIERLRVTPASRFALLIGPILMWNAWTLISSAALITISVAFGFHIHLFGLLLFALLLVMLLTIFAAWATAMAILMKGDIQSISGVVTGLNLPILLLAGVMLPLTLAPGWMRTLAHFDPLYYAVEAGRDLAAGQVSTHGVALAFAVLVPLSCFVLWWATRVYREAVS
jgi:ABC-2 type transport system permease protein